MKRPNRKIALAFVLGYILWKTILVIALMV